jgi:hypothetical protein
MIDTTKPFNGKEKVMKKIIQISLVVILVFVLFQAVNIGSIASSGSVGASTASRVSSPVHASAEGLQMAACLVRIKGVVCVRPQVGWNS